MKKIWLSALVAVAVAGVGGAAAWGEGVLRISLNGEEVNDNLPESTAKATEDLIKEMGGFVDYRASSGKMEIIKPNVNVLVLEGIQQTKNKTLVFSNPISGYADKDVPRTFNVFVEVDEAPASRDLQIRLELIGPDGKTVDRGKEWKYNTQRANSFYFSEPFVSTKLERYGTYKIQVQMKLDDDERYVTVGENSFTVGR